MKTLVLGGGVVGVTTAYFLARAGHEVTVLEEKDGLGLEATAGNAGIIAPGHPETIFPDHAETVIAWRQSLGEQATQKLMWENAARFFRLTSTPW